MIRILVSILLLTSLSCTPMTRARKFERQCKDALIDHLKTAWSFDEEEGIYHEGKGMLATIEFMPCLAGMKQDEIIRLFGVPNLYMNSKLYYFYSKVEEIESCKIFICGGGMTIRLTPNGQFGGMGFPAAIQIERCG